ncbi:MAG: O-antigen ligase family protein [Desulfobacterales bacterium]|nr:O-antigen ligase family protein [Desulfobacterales bacterium]
MILVIVMCGAVTLRSAFLYSAFGVGALALLLSFSRAGWLSLIIGAGVLYVQLVRAKYLSFSRMIVGILGALLFGVILFGAFQNEIIARFTDRRAMSAIQSRVLLLKQGVDVVKKYPLLGIGPGITEYFGVWNDKVPSTLTQIPHLYANKIPPLRFTVLNAPLPSP